MENAILEFTKKYKKFILTLILGVIVFVAGSSLYTGEKEKQNQTAANDLYKARKTLAEEFIKVSSALFPVTSTSQKSKETPEQPKVDPKMETAQFDVDSQLKASIDSLKKVVEKHPSTHAAYQASLTLRDLYLEHTTSQDKGIEHYQTALKHAQNSLEKGRVHLALGYVLENKASYQEALSQFEQAYRLDVEGAKGELLLSMARCYQQLKNNAKAISIYDQISKDLKNTEYAKIAEQKKKHLN